MKPICTDGGIGNFTFKLIGIVLNHRVHDDILDLSDQEENLKQGVMVKDINL